MPVEKKYESNAQRQAAYRARHPERHVATDAELAGLARYLQFVLSASVAAGTFALPDVLVSGRADQTLRNLIRYLDPNPDPVRYSGRQWQTSPGVVPLTETPLSGEA